MTTYRSLRDALNQAGEAIAGAELENDQAGQLAEKAREQLRQEWLSVSEYARVYGVDRGTVYKWLAAGDILQTYQVGTLRRIKNIPPAENLRPAC